MDNTNQELISVIIPVYNTAAYLKRCMESVLGQTYQNFEAILVDGASTDGSSELCDEYRAKDARVRVIHQEHLGVSAARNAALDAAGGSLIAFVDSDDVVTTEYLEHLYEALKAKEAEIAVSGYQNVRDEEEVSVISEDDNGVMLVCNVEEALERAFYQNKMYTTLWGKLYRAELFDGLRFPEGKIYEDIPVVYELIMRSKRIVIRDVVDYFYFIRKESLTHVPFSPRDLDAIRFMNEVEQRMKQSYPELVPACKVRTFWLSMFLVLRIKPGKYVKLRKRLWKRIIRARSLVLKNRKVQPMHKMVALCSYLGYYFTYTTYSIYGLLKGNNR